MPGTLDARPGDLTGIVRAREGGGGWGEGAWSCAVRRQLQTSLPGKGQCHVRYSLGTSQGPSRQAVPCRGSAPSPTAMLEAGREFSLPVRLRRLKGGQACCPRPPCMAPDWKPPVQSLTARPPSGPAERMRPVGEGQGPCSGAGAPGRPGSLSRAVCAPHEFQCSNRSCLAAVFVCDGDDDCGDGSDERGCADPACGPREFRCGGGGGGGGGACIPERWVCDRQFDCEDRSDEAAELCGRAGPGATAAPASCAAAAQFACRSGECVHLGWRCDGDRDCKDKSDEADCRKPPPPVLRGPAAPFRQARCAGFRGACPARPGYLGYGGAWAWGR